MRLTSHKGFTFIETILTLMVLGGGVLGVLTIYNQNIARANEMEQTLIATSLAEQKLEQILHDKKYQLYAYVIQANYPTENLLAQGYPGYTRTTTILEVDPVDLSTAKNGSGYKKITVMVQTTGGLPVSIPTLVTLWGEDG
ncbi:MAG: hypothetical protein Q7T03_01780 [Deltaproteobacteria bacterium]|nr:hypothetical protein [Deltaproteobacteria bacterium]